MIEVVLTFEWEAVRGGYYKQLSRPGRTFPVGGQSGNYYSMTDDHYTGRHPFNIITEEIYD